MNIAKRLLFVTGLFPISVGGYYYLGSLFSSAPLVERHVANTNLIAVGVLTIILALQLDFNEFRVSRLYTGIFLVLWSGGNDFYILMRNAYFPESTFFVFPFPLFPLTLGSISLFIQSFNLNKDQALHAKASRVILAIGLIVIFSFTTFRIMADQKNYINKIEQVSGK